ncbi:MAG: HD domain-containing protein [Elusimicrobiota bacterium]
MNFDNFVNGKELIKAAEKFATKKHHGQTRKFTGKPYIIHPQQVSELVSNYGGSLDMIAAAWLHDVMEDCGVKFEKIKEKFGDKVAKLVKELTIPPYADKSGKKSDYIAKEMEIMSSDGLTIKLCDRLSNVLNFEIAHPKFVLKYAPKTKFILDSLEDSQRPLNAVQKKLVKEIRKKIEPYLEEE